MIKMKKKKAKWVEENCIMCRACMTNCPVKAIDRKIHIDWNLCIGCGTCTKVCQHAAMVLEEVECD